MEHPYLFLVKVFEWFGPGAAHFAHAYPYIIYSWFVMIFLIVCAAIATKGISMIPTKGQNFFEIVISGMEEFMVDITVCNLCGLIPGFFPPTASINTTLSCAVPVFLFTHYIGVKYHGAKYVKHFLGPVWWMSPLILVIELIGHFARIMSLSFRLFGNIMGHELVLMILFMLAGAFFAPLPIMAMGIFVSFVQAFVFFLLSIMYFAGAMEHAH
jgi:F-type H+-transporting ATPase subunit a